MSSVGIGDEAGKVEPEPAQAPAELPVPPPVVPTEPPAVPTEPPSTPAPKVVVPAAAPVQSGGTPGDAVMETPGGSTGPGEPSNSVSRPMRGQVCSFNVQRWGPKYGIFIAPPR